MLPQDPMILLSYLNTKLRDDYASLDLLCEDMAVDRSAIEEKMASVDCRYDEQLNKFL